MILVLGNHCNNGLVICELLSRYSIDCRLVTMPYDPEIKISLLKYFNYRSNITVFNQTETTSLIINSKLVISSAAAIISIGIKNYIKIFLRSKVRFFNIATGSDFSEFLIENSFISKFFRKHVAHSDLNWIFPVPSIINILQKQAINNIFISPHPFLLSSDNPSSSKKLNIQNTTNTINFLHASNLDWGVNDNKQNRNSTKGNNKFLLQFFRASEVLNIHCYIIERGPDVAIAKKMIKDNNKEQCFTWIPSVPSIEFSEIIKKYDIIVDQFDIGCPGMIAMESMALGKPVMIYFENYYGKIMYKDPPPIINCHTEDEIYKAITNWSEREKLKTLGEKAQMWVRKYHDVHTADFSEFILRACIAAGLEWPRKDLAKAKSTI